MKCVKPIDRVTTLDLLRKNLEKAAFNASSLLEARENSETDDSYEQYWFTASKVSGDPQEHTPGSDN